MTKILIDEALDKMADNARELGLSYEQSAPAQEPVARWDGRGDLIVDSLPDGTLLYTAAQAPAQPLTEADYYNACLSYRHDFGLMRDEDRQKLIFEAKEWARAFGITKGGA